MSHATHALTAAALAVLIAASATPADAATPQNATQGMKKESDGGHMHPMAGKATVGAVTIAEAYARPRIGRAPNSGAYMMLTATAPDRLIAAETPAAARTELHTHINEGGVMKMRPVEGGIAVQPGEPTMLAPGGLHVMLMGITAPMREGDTIALTLTFEKAGSVTVQVPVRAVAAGGGHRHTN